MHNQGFTLLELLITLSITTLLLSVGVPQFATQINNNRVKTTTLHLLEAVELTRTHAVMANRRTTIRNRGSWQDGWDIFVDSNNNGLQDQNERLLASSATIKNIHIVANQPLRNYISYVGSGEGRFAGTAEKGAFQAGTIIICPMTKGNGYELILARGGRMRMLEINADKCSALQ